MLAEPVSAATALQLGLLTSVVPDDELPAAAAGSRPGWPAGPTLAYAAIKESLLYAAAHRLGESLEQGGRPADQARPERRSPGRHPRRS